MKFTTFEEFWPYYVSQHLDDTCRMLHIVGTGLALGCVAASPFMPWMALVAPVCGYGFAWVGHFGFEHNKPAAFKNPWWSLLGDLRMFYLTLTGNMSPELARARNLSVVAA